MLSTTDIVAIISTATSSIALLLFSINWEEVDTRFPPIVLIKALMSFTDEGKYIDFSWAWFASTGVTIAVSNVISAASQILALKPFLKKSFWRWRDRFWSKDLAKTRKNS